MGYIPSFVVKKLCNLVQGRIRLARLRQAVADFVDAEEAVKTGKLQDRPRGASYYKI
ncbi:MAG: hypothetical protein V8Q57_05745 [Blautia sp.]